MSFTHPAFGTSKEEIWNQLAAEIHANYVPGGWSGAKVQAQHGPWTITLDAYTETLLANDVPMYTEYTRIRAPYLNRDGFRFNIYRAGLLSGVSKWLGMQDVEVGFPAFDEAFIIQGNDEKKLRALFAHEQIRELIEAQSTIGLWVRGDQAGSAASFPKGSTSCTSRPPGSSRTSIGSRRYSICSPSRSTTSASWVRRRTRSQE
jgi:hypothetical protein